MTALTAQSVPEDIRERLGYKTWESWEGTGNGSGVLEKQHL